jgi:phosphoribosylaminoimidazolecarboxamide formyltransferase/IMP cyclohydrolase
MVHDSKSHRALRYGLNPNQAGAQFISPGGPSPLDVLSGDPGFINLLDAIRGWKLVRELRRRFDRPSAASFKQVNPAGVGLGGGDLPEVFMATHFFGDLALSPLATAYLRARQGDRISSYGDFVALSDRVDIETAEVLKGVASDGVIAPSFTPEALTILRRKRKGRYLVLAIDPTFEPGKVESRTEFGLTMTQGRRYLRRPRSPRCEGGVANRQAERRQPRRSAAGDDRRQTCSFKRGRDGYGRTSHWDRSWPAISHFSDASGMHEGRHVSTLTTS